MATIINGVTLSGLTFGPVTAPLIVVTVNSSVTNEEAYPVVTGTVTNFNVATDVLTFTMNGTTYGQDELGSTNVQFNGNDWTSDTWDYNGWNGPDDPLEFGNTYPVVATVTSPNGTFVSQPANIECVDPAVGAALTVNNLTTTNPSPIITGTASLETDEFLSLEINGFLFDNIPVVNGVWSVNTSTDVSEPAFVPLVPGPYVATAEIILLDDSGPNETATGTITIAEEIALSVYDITVDDLYGNYRLSGTVRQLNIGVEYLHIELNEIMGSWAWDSIGTYPSGVSLYGNYWQVDSVPGGEFPAGNNGPYTITAEIRLVSDDSVIVTATGYLTQDTNFVIPNIDVSIDSQTTSEAYPVITGTADLPYGSTMYVYVNNDPAGVTYYDIVPDGTGNWSIDTATAVGDDTVYPITQDTNISVNGQSMYGQYPDDSGMITFAVAPPTVNPATYEPGYPIVTGTATVNPLTDWLQVTYNGSVYGDTYPGEGFIEYTGGNNWLFDNTVWGPITGPDIELEAGNVYPAYATVYNAGGSLQGPSSDLTCENLPVTVDVLPPGYAPQPIITGTASAPAEFQYTISSSVNEVDYVWTISIEEAGTWSLDTSVVIPDGENETMYLNPGVYGQYLNSTQLDDIYILVYLTLDANSATSVVEPLVSGTTTGEVETRITVYSGSVEDGLNYITPHTYRNDAVEAWDLNLQSGNPNFIYTLPPGNYVTKIEDYDTGGELGSATGSLTVSSGYYVLSERTAAANPIFTGHITTSAANMLTLSSNDGNTIYGIWDLTGMTGDWIIFSSTDETTGSVIMPPLAEGIYKLTLTDGNSNLAVASVQYDQYYAKAILPALTTSDTTPVINFRIDGYIQDWTLVIDGGNEVDGYVYYSWTIPNPLGNIAFDTGTEIPTLPTGGLAMPPLPTGTYTMYLNAADTGTYMPSTLTIT